MKCPNSPVHETLVPCSFERTLASDDGTKVTLKNIPGFRCLDCQRQGRTTYVPDAIDVDAVLKRVGKPTLEAIKGLAALKGSLVHVTLDFNPGQEPAILDVREPRFRLHDLVLPAPLKSNVNRLIKVLRGVDRARVFRDIPALRNTCINLFGPPGTGKSACVEAIAQALGRDLLVVDYAQLESKYVGETPKNIVAAFDTARERRALLLFDEADSFLSSRLTELRQATDYSVNLTRSVMLKALDDYDGVVFFSTNLIGNYDRAFLRRILFFLEFRLPECEEMNRIFQLKMPPGICVVDKVDFSQTPLAQGLSGADVEKIAIQCVMLAAAESSGSFRVTQEVVEELVASIVRVKSLVDRGNVVPAITVPDKLIQDKLFDAGHAQELNMDGQVGS
jgi:hypothetical protein